MNFVSRLPEPWVVGGVIFALAIILLSIFWPENAPQQQPEPESDAEPEVRAEAFQDVSLVPVEQSRKVVKRPARKKAARPVVKPSPKKKAVKPAAKKSTRKR